MTTWGNFFWRGKGIEWFIYTRYHFRTSCNQSHIHYDNWYDSSVHESLRLYLYQSNFALLGRESIWILIIFVTGSRKIAPEDKVGGTKFLVPRKQASLPTPLPQRMKPQGPSFSSSFKKKNKLSDFLALAFSKRCKEFRALILYRLKF